MNLVEKLQGRIKEQRKRIVIIGDVMVDRWIHCKTAECQDNCVKFIQEGVVDVPGGAANAERSISGWKGETELFGHWKMDRGIKTRFVDQDGKIVFRHDNDIQAGVKYDQARVDSLEWVECAGAVLLSDYDKGFLTLNLIRDVVSICKRRGIPCVADCKREPDVYAGCILKGNEDYWSRYCAPISVEIVMTRGDRQPWTLSLQRDMEYPQVKCVNHVGAGDCFSAHLTLALAYGFSLKEATQLAHSAGRIYVQHPHNRPPLPSEIATDLTSIG